ncbi:hypothetical protein D3C75_526510 [compost metagenome]
MNSVLEDIGFIEINDFTAVTDNNADSGCIRQVIDLARAFQHIDKSRICRIHIDRSKRNHIGVFLLHGREDGGQILSRPDLVSR